MAALLGVTRLTYFGWINGKPIRKKNDAKVRKSLRVMLVLLTEHAWPQPHVIAMDPDERFKTLVELFDQLNTPE